MEDGFQACAPSALVQFLPGFLRIGLFKSVSSVEAKELRLKISLIVGRFFLFCSVLSPLSLSLQSEHGSVCLQSAIPLPSVCQNAGISFTLGIISTTIFLTGLFV